MDLDQLDLNPRIIAAVKKAKLKSAKEVLHYSGPDLQRLTSLSSLDVQQLLRTASSRLRGRGVSTGGRGVSALPWCLGRTDCRAGSRRQGGDLSGGRGSLGHPRFGESALGPEEMGPGAGVREAGRSGQSGPRAYRCHRTLPLEASWPGPPPPCSRHPAPTPDVTEVTCLSTPWCLTTPAAPLRSQRCICTSRPRAALHSPGA